MSVADRIRHRLKDEMQARGLSQRDVALLITEQTGERWNQADVQKIVSGYIELKMNDLAAIADAIGITLCEAVRDPGREYVADLTPSEVRLLQRLQRRPEMLDAIMTLLNMPPSDHMPRTVLGPKPKRGRPPNSSLPVGPEQQPDGVKNVTAATKTTHDLHRSK